MHLIYVGPLLSTSLAKKPKLGSDVLALVSPLLADLSTCARILTDHRVCVKELPKTLVVHLKRFEFDMETMQRIKVNDYYTVSIAIHVFRPFFSPVHFKRAK